MTEQALSAEELEARLDALAERLARLLAAWWRKHHPEADEPAAA